MPKVIQSYKLWTLLSSGEAVEVQKIAETLGIKYYSVPVYIHELKKLYKADVQSVRSGRKVTAYKLVNSEKVKVPMYRSNNAQYVAKTTTVSLDNGAVPVLDKDNDLVVMDDKTLTDVKESLGLDTYRRDFE